MITVFIGLIIIYEVQYKNPNTLPSEFDNEIEQLTGFNYSIEKEKRLNMLNISESAKLSLMEFSDRYSSSTNYFFSDDIHVTVLNVDIYKDMKSNTVSIRVTSKPYDVDTTILTVMNLVYDKSSNKIINAKVIDTFITLPRQEEF